MININKSENYVSYKVINMNKSENYVSNKVININKSEIIIAKLTLLLNKHLKINLVYSIHDKFTTQKLKNIYQLVILIRDSSINEHERYTRRIGSEMWWKLTIYLFN